MLPKGFVVNGINCRIKKDKSEKDLALFYSAHSCVAAGMFTSNRVKAAPVSITRRHLMHSGDDIRALIVNSGCANACTGNAGLKDAEFMCQLTASELGITSQQVLVSSTGVIGELLPIGKIAKGIDKLSFVVTKNKSNPVAAARAIMTTDTFQKIYHKSIGIGSKTVNIWGCAKGAGMIHPDLKGLHATMLSYILTDADISRSTLERLTKIAVGQSFNCITVDGDTSTNDTVLVLANGAANNTLINREEDKYCRQFSYALNEVCLELAKMIVKDGEGARHLVEIEVVNARSEKSAKKIAATVATSPLVKTAIFGNDANWGRIIAACGRSGEKISPDRINIYLGKVMVVKNGVRAVYSEKLAKKMLQRKEVEIKIDLKTGDADAVYYTCDLSLDYVKINASYRS